jgi:hypothetical protein
VSFGLQIHGPIGLLFASVIGAQQPPVELGGE